MLNCADEEEAIGIARDLRRVNPTAVYEIRPIRLYLPGEALPETASGQEGGQCTSAVSHDRLVAAGHGRVLGWLAPREQTRIR